MSQVENVVKADRVQPRARVERLNLVNPDFDELNSVAKPSREVPTLAPLLMMTFWMLLGGAAGINATQSLWRVFEFTVGDIAIAVPVGGAVGALMGALLGLVTRPRQLVLLMAVFAGASAGAVAGRVPWGTIGELSGQAIGALVGGAAWAVWLYRSRGHSADGAS